MYEDRTAITVFQRKEIACNGTDFQLTEEACIQQSLAGTFGLS
jgi:hypothetical protein